MENLIGQGYPGKGIFVVVGVYATKEELGARGSKLETEHGRIHLTLGDKSLECRICAIDRYGFETHAHQAIGRERAALETRRILVCGAKRLSRRLC